MTAEFLINPIYPRLGLDSEEYVDLRNPTEVARHVSWHVGTPLYQMMPNDLWKIVGARDGSLYAVASVDYQVYKLNPLTWLESLEAKFEAVEMLLKHHHPALRTKALWLGAEWFGFKFTGVLKCVFYVDQDTSVKLTALRILSGFLSHMELSSIVETAELSYYQRLCCEIMLLRNA